MHNSQKMAYKKIWCGNYICFIQLTGFSHCLGMDKTIATHTKGICIKPMTATQNQ